MISLDSNILHSNLCKWYHNHKQWLSAIIVVELHYTIPCGDVPRVLSSDGPTVPYNQGREDNSRVETLTLGKFRVYRHWCNGRLIPPFHVRITSKGRNVQQKDYTTNGGIILASRGIILARCGIILYIIPLPLL